MGLDVLDANLKDVPTLRAEPYPFFMDGKLMTGRELFAHLSKHGGTLNRSLWVMTYTVGAHGLTVPITRLVHCLPIPRGTPAPPKVKRRQICNVHAKLYIVNYKDQPVEAFIGSQNLCAPTSANLVVRVDDSVSLQKLIKYFNHHWNL